jgi:hypothetical protein
MEAFTEAYGIAKPYHAPMKSDDMLLVVVTLGIALTCVYLVSEFVVWQTIKASNHEAFLQARVFYKKLHAATHRAIRRRGPL